LISRKAKESHQEDKDMAFENFTIIYILNVEFISLIQNLKKRWVKQLNNED